MPTQPADLCINSRWMLPMTGRDTLLEGCSLVVRDARIIDILPTPEARVRYTATDTVERPGHLLLPGLVGARTDSAGAPPASRVALAALLRGGVTCFATLANDPAAAARGAVEQGMRVVLGLGVGTAPPVRRTPAEQITAALQVRDEYKTHPLVSTAFAPDLASDLDDAVLERLGTLADELDTPLLVSLHASAVDVAASLTAHRQRPIERLHRLGLLSPSLDAAHMVHVTAQDLDLALRSGISITLCPGSDFERDAGIAPFEKYLAHGIRLGLGGVYAADDAAWDPWFDLRLLDLLPPVLHGKGGAPLWDCLAAATIGGAAALGLDHEIGTLQVGKWADLCCLDLEGPEGRTPRAPLSAAVRGGGRERVSDVWVAGRRLLNEGMFTRFSRSHA